MSAQNKPYKWQGRQDFEDGNLGIRWHNAINQNANDTHVALQGYASDIGAIENKGRAGANSGPNAIRDALASMAWHLPVDIYDANNVTAPANINPSDQLQRIQQDYAAAINSLLQDHQLVIGIGGSHDIALGSFNGLAQFLTSASNKRIGIINFDAHFDLRKPAPNPSSGTPFYQIEKRCKEQNVPFNYTCLGVAQSANTQALYQRAKALDTRFLNDYECTFENTQKVVIPMLQNIDELYVTICLDAFAGYVAPGVSAPSVLGIELAYVLQTIKWLAQSQNQYGYRWRLTDIAEMNPMYDIDARTAKLAARLIFEICGAHFAP